MKYKIYDKVFKKVRGQVFGHVIGHVWNKVWFLVYHQVSKKFLLAVGISVDDQIKLEISNER